MALLIGFGAAAINPYMAFESIEDMLDRGAGRHGPREGAVELHQGRRQGRAEGDVEDGHLHGGLLHRRAAVRGDRHLAGRARRVLHRLTCPLGGIDLDEIAADVAARHQLAYLDRPDERAHRELEVGGEYQWRREGEYHLFNPDTVFKLQHATRTGQYDIFKEYTALVDDQSERMATLRGLFKFKDRRRGAPAVPIDEVEPASEIVKRFSTGAMSYGSISAEAHETLAIAMNRLGGGRTRARAARPQPVRRTPTVTGGSRSSRSPRAASASPALPDQLHDIQIKMAQGAKPGEGGQLPGHKVYPWVAETRHSTPGVGLISPPPHHDIYSIEDLAQLIHDLKNANPRPAST
jgi:glutamate synthase (NADPH/NADH) large chain